MKTFAEAYARKHGLQPFTTTCTDCGAAKTTTIPFVRWGRRGLKAPPCACGSASNTYCLALEDAQ